MIVKNGVSNIRQSLSAQLLRMYFGDTLTEKVDRIPIDLRPKGSESSRCCVYKDRAMLRYRMMALMGIDVETEDDEYKSLAQFAEKALRREKPSEKIITIIDISCTACQENSYIVTDICKGCVARPCESNCPKDAIKIINGRAIIDQHSCVGCGRCADVCSYNAIAYSPPPCEAACPVDAIHRNPVTGKEEIDYDKCIYCGRCTRACPFGTVMDRSQILDVAKHIKSEDKKVVALIAPSIVGQFQGKIGQVISALKATGFDYVYEVAYGADKTAKADAEELIEKVNGGVPMIGTSCCPAYVEAVKKHVRDFEPFISTAKTPMVYTAEFAKEDHPDSVTVFIGPCIAKKYEATQSESVDYVLTYEELSAFFDAKDIKIPELPESNYDTGNATTEARRFCVSGGVTEAVKFYVSQMAPSMEVKPFFINGLGKKGIRTLDNVAKGKMPGNNMIEVMACEGGCVAGPGVIVPPSVSARKLEVKS